MNQIFLPEYPFSYKLSASVFKYHHSDQSEEVCQKKLYIQIFNRVLKLCNSFRQVHSLSGSEHSNQIQDV